METASNADINWVRIRDGRLSRNGALLAKAPDAASMYRELGCSYPKFFKMDALSKWAWLGAEALLRTEAGWRYEATDLQNVGLVIATLDGCLEADKRYAESMETIASPALFVYTLPNIMLGEICIRHGFKGEQLCLVADEFDAESLQFQAQDLLRNRHLNHCLFGWADAVGDHQDICLFWAPAAAAGSIRAEWLQAMYQSN
jgi:hypothetical protein